VTFVPADARLLDWGSSRRIDQSALTGESLPTERKSGEAIYSGSILRQGSQCNSLRDRFKKLTSVRRGNSADRTDSQPFSKGQSEDWQDYLIVLGFGAVNASYCRCDTSRGFPSYNLAVRLGV